MLELRDRNKEEILALKDEHEKEMNRLREEKDKEIARIREEKQKIETEMREEAHKKEIENLKQMIEVKTKEKGQENAFNVMDIFKTVVALKTGQTPSADIGFQMEPQQKQWKDVIMSVVEKMGERISPQTIDRIASIITQINPQMQPQQMQLQQMQPQPQQMINQNMASQIPNYSMSMQENSTPQPTSTPSQPASMQFDELSEAEIMELTFKNALKNLNNYVTQYSPEGAAQLFSGDINGKIFATWIGTDVEQAFNNMVKFYPQLQVNKDKVIAVLKSLMDLYQQVEVSNNTEEIKEIKEIKEQSKPEQSKPRRRGRPPKNTSA